MNNDSDQSRYNQGNQIIILIIINYNFDNYILFLQLLCKYWIFTIFTNQNLVLNIYLDNT